RRVIVSTQTEAVLLSLRRRLCGRAFFQLVDSVGGEGCPALLKTVRPANCQAIDSAGRAEAEVKSRIVGRKIAGTGAAEADLLAASGLHGDLCAVAVAVAFYAFQLNKNPVAGPTRRIP